MKSFRLFLKDTKGQALTEYALILALVAIVAIVALTDVGTAIKDIFSDILSGLGGTASS